MEPITTELRRSMSERSDAFTGVSVAYCEKDRFVQLCDAIDAVHARLEQENDELGKTVYDMRREFDEWKHSLDEGFASADDWLAQHEDEMAEHGWYRALDADGTPWRIGDMAKGTHYQSHVHSVCGVGEINDKPVVFYLSEHGLHSSNPHEGWDYTIHVHHYHAPTVEDVLEELLREYDRDDSGLTNGEIVERFAKRLKLAGDAS